MNRNFKVVFSKARGALMVVNEATSSVQAKGTKTVIAAAVAALSLSAQAWLRLILARSPLAPLPLKAASPSPMMPLLLAASPLIR